MEFSINKEKALKKWKPVKEFLLFYYFQYGTNYIKDKRFVQ